MQNNPAKIITKNDPLPMEMRRRRRIAVTITAAIARVPLPVSSPEEISKIIASSDWHHH